MPEGKGHSGESVFQQKNSITYEDVVRPNQCTSTEFWLFYSQHCYKRQDCSEHISGASSKRKPHVWKQDYFPPWGIVQLLCRKTPLKSQLCHVSQIIVSLNLNFSSVKWAQRKMLSTISGLAMFWQMQSLYHHFYRLLKNLKQNTAIGPFFLHLHSSANAWALLPYKGRVPEVCIIRCYLFFYSILGIALHSGEKQSWIQCQTRKLQSHGRSRCTPHTEPKDGGWAFPILLKAQEAQAYIKHSWVDHKAAAPKGEELPQVGCFPCA
jgi:hypothetical protein